MIFFGGAALIVACALQIGWVGRLARDRGRNVVAWILVGLMAGGLGLRLGIYVVDRASDAEGAFAGLLGTMAPFPLTLGGMLAVAGMLYLLPTHLPARRDWKITSAKHGDGTLVLDREVVELRWEGRTDTIERSQLRSAVADGECVRVTWASGEALLMPMMSPQTREGRIRQSELLAKLLAAPGTAA
jgi:hypothetical protein